MLQLVISLVTHLGFRYICLGQGVRLMPLTQKQRDLKRRRRRVRKLRELKSRLAVTQDTKTRRMLLEKIKQISPWDEVLNE